METIRMRACHSVTLMEVTVLEGSGTGEDLYREVTYFFRVDGSLAAIHDVAEQGDQLRKRFKDWGQYKGG